MVKTNSELSHYITGAQEDTSTYIKTCDFLKVHGFYCDFRQFPIYQTARLVSWLSQVSLGFCPTRWECKVSDVASHYESACGSQACTRMPQPLLQKKVVLDSWGFKARQQRLSQKQAWLESWIWDDLARFLIMSQRNLKMYNIIYNIIWLYLHVYFKHCIMYKYVLQNR